MGTRKPQDARRYARMEGFKPVFVNSLVEHRADLSGWRNLHTWSNSAATDLFAWRYDAGPQTSRMTEPTPKSMHLDERLLKRTAFVLPWLVFLFVVLRFVSLPIRNCAVVCWVYGWQAYFHEGIRVVPGKPVRFSTGVEVPTVPDLITGFGAFFITIFGLTILLIFALRIYERRFLRTNSTPHGTT